MSGVISSHEQMDESSGHQQITEVITHQMDEESIRVSALRSLFDIVLVHGIECFQEEKSGVTTTNKSGELLNFLHKNSFLSICCSSKYVTF